MPENPRPQGRPALPEEEKKFREAVLLEPAIIAAVKRQAHALSITRSAMYRLLILEALDARK